MATNPLAAAMFPNLTRNEPALKALGEQLSPEDSANLRKITGIDFEHPENSLASLPRMEKLLADNPNAVQNMANMPSQLRTTALADAAQKESAAPGSGFSVLEAIAKGHNPQTPAVEPQTPANTNPAQVAASPTATPGNTPATPSQPAAANPSQPASTPQTGAGGTQGQDWMKALMDSNPQMAGMMSRMTEMMQGLMGRLMTGLLGFIGKIFGGMDGSGGNLFAASSNPGSNNLGNALAIGGADQNQRVSLQVGDTPPQDTTVGALQQRGPGTPTTAPAALDPANRLAQNGPQVEPGRA